MKKCYASAFGECGGKKQSQEHYFPKCILKNFTKLNLEGFKFKTASVESMTSGILCENHNNHLSDLDVEICKMFKYLHDIDNRRNNLPVIEISVPKIERALLKMALGVMYAKVTTGDIGKIECRSEQMKRILFEVETMPKNCGLFLEGNLGEKFYGKDQVGFSWHENGFIFNLQNLLRFHLLLQNDSSDNKFIKSPGLIINGDSNAFGNGEIKFIY